MYCKNAYQLPLQLLSTLVEDEKRLPAQNRSLFLQPATSTNVFFLLLHEQALSEQINACGIRTKASFFDSTAFQIRSCNHLNVSHYDKAGRSKHSFIKVSGILYRISRLLQTQDLG